VLVSNAKTAEELRVELVALCKAEAEREASALARATTQKAGRYSEGAANAYRDMMHMLRTLRIEP
jgi:hypothetical protein